MKIYIYKNLIPEEVEQLTLRPAIDTGKTFEIVKPILKDIKENGLASAINYAKKFDGFTGDSLAVTRSEFDEAEKKLDVKIKDAIKTAADNIRRFHEKQLPKGYSVETMEGINCSREFRAIENAGLYIPGGTAVLPSTMLMLAIPAQIAGCPRIAACSPAKEGVINLPLLYAAKVCGVNEFYKIGGAQAVALMAYGDKSIKKVNKIFGPGNQYVTAAKMLVSIDPSGCAIDMPAGPSEVLIIADETANPSFIAADLLSQAEHGADSQAILVTTSELLAGKIKTETEIQLNKLPRKDFAKQALENSFILIVENIDDAAAFSNRYAPEHLIMNFANASGYTSKITNAGSVFIGQYSPESVGDYASGTNHSLPTSGYAKTSGGVSVESFMKSITFQELTPEGLKRISATVETLAETEGLRAHKNAVTIRLEKNSRS
ncbi:MAG: histidinol dehydrogenase [Ignavibacteriaceae bacterium]